MAERFDIFERKLLSVGRFLTWHGTYPSLEDANEKLESVRQNPRTSFM
jgi:hypothetical protein